MINTVEDQPFDPRRIAVDIAQAVEHLEHALRIINAWQTEQTEQRSARHHREILTRENRRGRA